MRFLPFLRSPKGNILLFGVFILLGGFMVFRSNARERTGGAH